MSLLPCFGHITSLAVSWAETGEIISIGDIEEINIKNTRKIDFLEFETGNLALTVDFIVIVAFLTLFERGRISCVVVSFKCTNQFIVLSLQLRSYNQLFSN